MTGGSIDRRGGKGKKNGGKPPPELEVVPDSEEEREVARQEQRRRIAEDKDGARRVKHAKESEISSADVGKRPGNNDPRNGWLNDALDRSESPRRTPGRDAPETPRKKSPSKTSRYVDGTESSTSIEDLDDDYTPLTPKKKTSPKKANRKSLPATLTSEGDAPSLTPTRSKSPSKAKVIPAVIDGRDKFAKQTYDRLNRKVFDNKLPNSSEVVFDWYEKLVTTAGKTQYDRHRDGSFQIKVILSPKILDDMERVKFTLSHEMCHLAVWYINEDGHVGHGPPFLLWKSLVETRCPDIQISITHSYDIHYTFKYKCQDCDQVYGRWTQSIKTDEEKCSKHEEGGELFLWEIDPRRLSEKEKRELSLESNHGVSRPRDAPAPKVRKVPLRQREPTPVVEDDHIYIKNANTTLGVEDAMETLTLISDND